MTRADPSPLAQGRGLKLLIAPSLLSADLARLGEEVERIQAAGADLLHVDVMDGHFVPNITFGPAVVKAIKRHAKRPLDVHLMICEPQHHADAFLDAGADILTFHVEATSHARELLKHIRQRGAKASLSLKPASPVEEILPYLDALDMVLVMTVNPGFGGQKLMPECLPKISQLRDKVGGNLDIEVDGGINVDTIGDVAKAGANVIVAGNAVFHSHNPAETIRHLKERLRRHSLFAYGG